MDGNPDPSYKDGFRRCIEETANAILNTPVEEGVKQHFISQLKLLHLGQEHYSPLTPEYERYEQPKYTPSAGGPRPLFPGAVGGVSPSSPNISSPFLPDRQSAFNAVERTVIKQEVRSPEHEQNPGNGIWRPW